VTPEKLIALGFILMCIGGLAAVWKFSRRYSPLVEGFVFAGVFVAFVIALVKAVRTLLI